MSNSRTSIVVEPLQTGADGQPILPTKPDEGPGKQSANPLEFTVPEDIEGIDPRYRGKSVQDIINMHVNADRKIGELGNEIGTWRQLVASLPREQQAAPGAAAIPPETQETELEISSDELLTNPVEAISKVVERSIGKALKPLEDSVQETRTITEQEKLLKDFPDFPELGNDEAFVTWATATGTRTEDAQAAMQGDTKAARRLLEAWHERETLIQSLQQSDDGGGNSDEQAAEQQQQATTQTIPAEKPQGMDGARQSQTERGGTGGAPTGPTMTADDIVKMIINDPDKYRSPEYQEQVMEAAKSGKLKLGHQPSFVKQ